MAARWITTLFSIISCTNYAYGCGGAAGGAGIGAGVGAIGGAVGEGAGHAGLAIGQGIGAGAGHVFVPIVGPGKCIYEEAYVRMADGSKRQVKHLEIGDQLLAYSVEKGIHQSRVYAEFFHDNQTLVKIVEIETSNGRKIPVTPQHSLFVRQCLSDDQKSWTTKSAHQIRVGDCLPRYYTNGDVVEESVTNIRVFEARGIRQPVTETGTIIVDDVVISCYDRVVSQQATHMALFPYQWLVGLTQTYKAQLTSLIPSLLNVIGFDSSLF